MGLSNEPKLDIQRIIKNSILHAGAVAVLLSLFAHSHFNIRKWWHRAPLRVIRSFAFVGSWRMKAKANIFHHKSEFIWIFFVINFLEWIFIFNRMRLIEISRVDVTASNTSTGCKRWYSMIQCKRKWLKCILYFSVEGLIAYLLALCDFRWRGYISKIPV